MVHNEKIDYLLAVGGGSVIDGTKFIAAAADYVGDPGTSWKPSAATSPAPFRWGGSHPAGHRL